jgi:hypothetical protein
LLVAEEWTDPDSLAMRLGYDLAEGYLVVADPTVRGFELDVVVVGPQGLFVLHDGAANGPQSVKEEPERGPGPEEPAPYDEVEERVTQATEALKAFLRDEFPLLTPKLHHLLVLAEPVASQEPSVELPCASLGSVAHWISSTEVPARGALPDPELREKLAVALRERRLTASQRASKPFVFRSGRALGSGSEVWTIRGAVRHMDANPESGIYHLRNDTLAKWFHDEGAEHLAWLARDVLRRELDDRAALETLLIGTGLVARPRLRWRPGEIELGYLLAGESAARRFRLGKRGGRGYLFGSLEPAVPWLSVHPREFSGESGWSVITVRAKTESLPIRREPRRAAVIVHSNASEAPVEVPVRLRLVGMPSALNRYVLRPAAGLLAGGVLGAVVGLLLTARGVPADRLLAELAWPRAAPTTVWVASMALLWAALGALRGAGQSLAWPIGYGIGRWLFRILVWALSLGIAGAAAERAWADLRPVDAAPVAGIVTWLMVLGPVALAIVPATVGEIRAKHDERDTSLRAIRWSFLRPLLLPAGAFVLALAVRLGAPRLRPLWQRVDRGEAISTAGRWIADRMAQLEQGIQKVIDELYLRYYEG